MSTIWHKETLTRDTMMRLADQPAIIPAADSSPYFLHRIAKQYFKDRAVKMLRSRAKKIRELESKRFVQLTKLPNNTLQLDLTATGRSIVKKMALQEALERVRLPKTWNQSWYLIIHDIPASNKTAQNNFKRVIKKWNAYSLQKGVYVLPYNCRLALDKVCQLLEIEPDHILCLESKKIPNKKEVEKHFGL
jgi:hypothetical protein